ncbi:MAG: hypothetical protein M1482_15095 [Chloroflexi bacterium]|nr:hypothetical protein [Chloroflexota bacterium]
MKTVTIARLLVVGIAVCLAFLVITTVLADGPTGLGPGDPFMVPAGEQVIAPNTTLWFYFDYQVEYPTSSASSGEASTPVAQAPTGRGGRDGFGGGALPSAVTGSIVDITVDASGNKGIQFGVYTPGQAATWFNDPSVKPVGRGTPYRDTVYNIITHDLFWSGRFNAPGRYFVAVSNLTTSTASFQMTVQGDTAYVSPVPTITPTPTIYVPLTLTVVPTATIQGKVLFETATGGAIYTVNGDGSNLAFITHGIDPSWSPDGKQITFARWDNTNPGLFISNADGSDLKALIGYPRIRWPRWSPDGKYIAFSWDKSKSESDIIWKVGVIEVATGKISEPQSTQLSFVPTWYTDSTTLVYTDPGLGLMRTSILGGLATVLLGPTGTYWDAGANIPRPIPHLPEIENSEWSPNGSRIAYSQQAHDRWEINVVNSDGSDPTGITNPDPIRYYALGQVVHNVAPTWSSDGKQILFLSNRDSKWEFFVINPDGSGLAQVLTNVTDKVSLDFAYQNERMMDWLGAPATSP